MFFQCGLSRVTLGTAALRITLTQITTTTTLDETICYLSSDWIIHNTFFNIIGQVLNGLILFEDFHMIDNFNSVYMSMDL